ncbi:hypothetical protein AJ78_00588 [Emergomyces pasteurianus Ep9510]|uniref:Uncharacterized protein n=1 Tax=Emergomyces pasteurianus Ep9510 TaxID=1447872 RepID=A0A1J9PT22_9EURO|nr:hypothetical protein AJ78_00588 [Emergomyces pasteurianus Ep9510]
MSAPAFQPIWRPSSTDTLIDPRGDHISSEECLAVLALLELSGCSPQEMRAAEIQLSWYCDYTVGSWMATSPVRTVYYPYTVDSGRVSATNTAMGFEGSMHSTLDDIQPLLAENDIYATPPQSPRAVLPANIHLGMHNMTIHTPQNTPPESDPSATGKKQSAQDSSENTGTSETSAPDEIGPSLDAPTNDVEMAGFPGKATTTPCGIQERASMPNSTSTLAAKSRPTKRSTRQRKDSRRMIEAKESEKLKGY